MTHRRQQNYRFPTTRPHIFPQKVINTLANILGLGSGTGQDRDGGIQDSIVSTVLLIHIDTDIGSNTKLGEVSAGIHDGTGGETHAPTVGQFAGKRQAATAASGVTHDGDLAERLHDGHEIVTGAEGTAVGQHYNGFQVMDVVLGWFKVVGIGLAQVIVALASLVADIPHEGFVVDKA